MCLRAGASSRSSGDSDIGVGETEGVRTTRTVRWRDWGMLAGLSSEIMIMNEVRPVSKAGPFPQLHLLLGCRSGVGGNVASTRFVAWPRACAEGAGHQDSRGWSLGSDYSHWPQN